MLHFLGCYQIGCSHGALFALHLQDQDFISYQLVGQKRFGVSLGLYQLAICHSDF